MKPFKLITPFLFLFLFTSLTCVAQKKRKIKLELSPSFERSVDTFFLEKSDNIQVRVSHNGITIWADKMNYYTKTDFIEAYGNVNIKQGDTIDLVSKYIEYSGKTQFAVAKGDVVMTNSNSVLSSQTLFFDRIKQEAFYNDRGKVVRDSSGTITSQIGRYYLDTQKYQFVKDVVLDNPDYIINTNLLDFYSVTGHAYLFGPSTITTEESKTTCEKCFYDTEGKLGYAIKNARIDYDNRILEGDSLYFDNSKKFASATNNIKMTDTINSVIIKGEYGEVHKTIDYAFVTKRALAITVRENDSTYIHSDTISVTGKEENRITRAYHNAKIFKSDLSGKADSINVNHKKGITTLVNLKRFSSSDSFKAKRNPVIWNIENQITGDTIQLIANKETEKLDSLKVFNDAFLISRDSLGNGFNQVKGKKLIGLFKDNELHTVDIIKNAEYIFYAYEEKELVGIDRSISAKMKIIFKNKTIETLERIGRPDGITYPLKNFTEDLTKFRGFSWRDDERPKSVEDLFKDDLPLVLPIIKGLDDYVPQEEFIEKELLDRINTTANKSLEKKLPQASKNIPKGVKGAGLLRGIKAKPKQVKGAKNN